MRALPPPSPRWAAIGSTGRGTRKLAPVHECSPAVPRACRMQGRAAGAPRRRPYTTSRRRRTVWRERSTAHGSILGGATPSEQASTFGEPGLHRPPQGSVGGGWPRLVRLAAPAPAPSCREVWDPSAQQCADSIVGNQPSLRRGEKRGSSPLFCGGVGSGRARHWRGMERCRAATSTRVRNASWRVVVRAVPFLFGRTFLAHCERHSFRPSGSLPSIRQTSDNPNTACRRGHIEHGRKALSRCAGSLPAGP